MIDKKVKLPERTTGEDIKKYKTEIQTQSKKKFSVSSLQCEVTLTSCFIVNHSGKVLNTKLSLVVVLRWDVVCVEFVLKVELVQHRGVCPLWDKQTGGKVREGELMAGFII